jgi:hypothetical protein
MANGADWKAKNYEALRSAIREGHSNIVRILQEQSTYIAVLYDEHTNSERVSTSPNFDHVSYLASLAGDDNRPRQLPQSDFPGLRRNSERQKQPGTKHLNRRFKPPKLSL